MTFTPLRYVPNVAKRSIWDQCKKKHILRTDRPTDLLFGKIQIAISPQQITWFTPCLILGCGFLAYGGSNGAVSSWTKFNRYIGLCRRKQCAQGRLSPQQPWRYPPFSRQPPPLCHPAHNFWTLFTQFCAILCVFSVNFGSCQSGIMTQKNPQKYKWSW